MLFRNQNSWPWFIGHAEFLTLCYYILKANIENGGEIGNARTKAVQYNLQYVVSGVNKFFVRLSPKKSSLYCKVPGSFDLCPGRGSKWFTSQGAGTVFLGLESFCREGGLIRQCFGFFVRDSWPAGFSKSFLKVYFYVFEL